MQRFEFNGENDSSALHDLFLHIYEEVKDTVNLGTESSIRELYRVIFFDEASPHEQFEWISFKETLLKEYLSNDIFVKDRLRRTVFVDGQPMEIEKYIRGNLLYPEIEKKLRLPIESSLEVFCNNNRAKIQIGISVRNELGKLLCKEGVADTEINYFYKPERINDESKRITDLVGNLLGVDQRFNKLSNEFKDQIFAIGFILTKVDVYALKQYEGKKGKYRKFSSYIKWPKPEKASCELYFNIPSEPDSKVHLTNFRLLLDYFMTLLWSHLSESSRDLMGQFEKLHWTNTEKWLENSVSRYERGLVKIDRSEFIGIKSEYLSCIKKVNVDETLIYRLYIYLYIFREYHLYAGLGNLSNMADSLPIQEIDYFDKEKIDQYFEADKYLADTIKNFLKSFYSNPQFQSYMSPGNKIEYDNSSNKFKDFPVLCYQSAFQMMVSDMSIESKLKTNEPNRTHNESVLKETAPQGFYKLFRDMVESKRSMTQKEFWYQRYIQYLDACSSSGGRYWTLYKLQGDGLAELNLMVKAAVSE
jgi:hypothetical protein